MIDYSKFDEAIADPRGTHTGSTIVYLQDEPEDADLSGWIGPGWYFLDKRPRVGR